MTYLAPCPFCGGPVRLVYDGTADGTCYGISHRPGACSILPTVWGAPGVPAGTVVRCWKRLPEVLYGDVVDFRPPMPVSADEMRQWAKSTADLLRLGFGAMDEKEARRWSTPPSL